MRVDHARRDHGLHDQLLRRHDLVSMIVVRQPHDRRDRRPHPMIVMTSSSDHHDRLL